MQYLTVSVEHPGLQPLPDQAQQGAIINTLRYHPHHPVMIDGVTELREVRFHHPGLASAWERDGPCIHCLQGSNLWPIPRATAQDVLLVDGFQEARHGQL